MGSNQCCSCNEINQVSHLRNESRSPLYVSDAAYVELIKLTEVIERDLLPLVPLGLVDGPPHSHHMGEAEQQAGLASGLGAEHAVRAQTVHVRVVQLRVEHLGNVLAAGWLVFLQKYFVL